jgi:peroxiredoxin
MIKVGQFAPDLQLTDTSGAAIRLHDFRGKSHVLIYFMRHTGCPMCNRHVKRLAANAADYAALGATIVVAVPDDAGTATRWAARMQLPFAVVMSAEGTPHAAIGLARKVFGSMQESGTVLVDRTGVVRYLNIATVPSGGYSHRAVMDAIAVLAGELEDK